MKECILHPLLSDRKNIFHFRQHGRQHGVLLSTNASGTLLSGPRTSSIVESLGIWCYWAGIWKLGAWFAHEAGAKQGMFLKAWMLETEDRTWSQAEVFYRHRETGIMKMLT